MCMLWLILHSSYYILYIHIRPSIPYIVGALSCIWGLLMRVFSGTGNAKYYSGIYRNITIFSDGSHATTSYPGSPCLKVLVHVEGPWQTLIARLPNNPKILEYLSTWPFLAMA